MTIAPHLPPEEKRKRKKGTIVFITQALLVLLAQLVRPHLPIAENIDPLFYLLPLTVGIVAS